MRAIDADALKESLKELKAKGYNQKYVQGLQDAIDGYFPQIIDDMPTIEVEPDKDWISVTDEMPRLGQRVMALCKADILTFLRYDGDVWFEMSSRNEYLLGFVTHWQPLPKLPKGE